METMNEQASAGPQSDSSGAKKTWRSGKTEEQAASVAVVEQLGRRAEETKAEREERIAGNKLVTTLGCVAAQSGDSRIVVVLAKDGEELQLKIQEMRPRMLDVGGGASECERLLAEQTRMVASLRRQRESPIEAWMAKYERRRDQEKGKAGEGELEQRRLVYTCMGENVASCWRALLNQLDRRSELLALASRFYRSADRFSDTLEKAEQHVRANRESLLAGVEPALEQLGRLNTRLANEFGETKRLERQLIQLVGLVGREQLGDSRPKLLGEEARALINYIASYVDPLARRKLELERAASRKRLEASNQQEGAALRIKEISNASDLQLVQSWLELKVEQLNSKLLSSLGSSQADSRCLLSRHDQILLECRTIEEATLKFNGRSIHAQQQSGTLLESQRAAASQARDAISALELRIVLLRRTIEFYQRAKEAKADIASLMRRLQLDNSLQSVEFVANELELKDVSSVVASGATIVSELQQLQLAQQQAERASLVHLNLDTSGVRSAIDGLNQDLAQLKSLLSQRRLVLQNEDSNIIAANFIAKCQQLQLWLDQQVIAFMLANCRIATDAQEAAQFARAYEANRAQLEHKTPEVEALLRSMGSLDETKAQVKSVADPLRRDWIQANNCLDRRLQLARKYRSILASAGVLEKELRALDRFSGRTFSEPELEADQDPRNEEEIRLSVNQILAQLAAQVKEFVLFSNTQETRIPDSRTSKETNDVRRSATMTPSEDLNKQQLIDHANGILSRFLKMRREIEKRIENSSQVRRTLNKEEKKKFIRDDSSEPPRFTKQLEDKTVEPFGTVELECELAKPNCRVEWFMNNFKKIPTNIRHSITSDNENRRHKLEIMNFSPVCCGTFTVRASDELGQTSLSHCRLKLRGIDEDQVSPSQASTLGETSVSWNQRRQTRSIQPSTGAASPAVSTTSSFSQWKPSGESSKQIERIIQGVDQFERTNQKRTSQIRETSSETTVTNRSNSTLDFRDSEQRNGRQGSQRKQQKQQQVQVAPIVSHYRGPVESSRQQVEIITSHIDSPSMESSSSLASRSISRSPRPIELQPPSFVEPLRTDSALRSTSNSRSGLVCVVVGNPAPNIDWYHNNQLIASAKCSKSGQADGKNVCKLTIETRNPDTRGQYVCRASNRLGETTSKFIVGPEQAR